MTCITSMSSTDFQDIQKVAKQCLTALQFLHEDMRLAHTDLKLENAMPATVLNTCFLGADARGRKSQGFAVNTCQGFFERIRKLLSFITVTASFIAFNATFFRRKTECKQNNVFLGPRFLMIS